MPTVRSNSMAGSGVGPHNRLSRCSAGRWTTVEESSSCRSSANACCTGWGVHENYCCSEYEKGVYCKSDASPPVVAVCDGTRWYELDTAGAGGVTGTGGRCTVALEDFVTRAGEECPATYEAAETWLASCEYRYDPKLEHRWSGSCDGYLAAARAHGLFNDIQACYYDTTTRRLVGAYFERDVNEFCGGTSDNVVAGRYPPSSCPSDRLGEFQLCPQVEATAGAGSGGSAGGGPIAGAAGKAAPP
jgi:hypothetical protein